jgi:hypothetical protein
MIEDMLKKKKPKQEYAMVQLDKELHTALKQYCKHHGFLMKGFIQALIRQALKNGK